MFGLKKIHAYIFGQPFELIINHKPLVSLLNEHRALSPQVFLVLRGGPYFCHHTSTLSSSDGTQMHGNEDGISQLLLPVEPPTQFLSL